MRRDNRRNPGLLLIMLSIVAVCIFACAGEAVISLYALFDPVPQDPFVLGILSFLYTGLPRMGFVLGALLFVLGVGNYAVARFATRTRPTSRTEVGDTE